MRTNKAHQDLKDQLRRSKGDWYETGLMARKFYITTKYRLGSLGRLKSLLQNLQRNQKKYLRVVIMLLKKNLMKE